MKKLVFFVLIFVLAFLIYSWDRTPPIIEWNFDDKTVVGDKEKLKVKVIDKGDGLASWVITIQQKKLEALYLKETFPAGHGPTERDTDITIKDLENTIKVSDGEFIIHVNVTDQSKFWFFKNTTRSQRTVILDSEPPTLKLRSGKHYIRQGGSQIILYSTTDKGTYRSGIKVGNRVFYGFSQNSKPNHHVALIGIDYNHTPDIPIQAWAEDLAGNRSELNIPHKIINIRFRKRNLTISDNFISKVSKDIFAKDTQVSPAATRAQTFVQINNHLRKLNHNQIKHLTRDTSNHLLFAGPFMQMSNTKVEAAFADERAYIYDGKVLDSQTHLGFDLASTSRSPVECANDGKVIWAGYLGIYGNCVIVDHGLGLSSLYGHLSSIETQAGMKVRKGQSLGRSGETGLAGGDHLHFTTLVQGTPVNSREWWDKKWVQKQVFNRLNSIK